MPGAHVRRLWSTSGMRNATPIPDRRSNSQAASRRWLTAWKLVRKLPEPVAFALGGVGGLLYHRLDRGRREALEANLGQVLGLPPGSRRLRRAVRRGFVGYGRYWVEAFRLEDLTAAEIRQRLRIEGREHIDAALAGGRGAIFASPHIGNWDAGGAWLAASGYPAPRWWSGCARPSCTSASPPTGAPWGWSCCRWTTAARPCAGSSGPCAPTAWPAWSATAT